VRIRLAAALLLAALPLAAQAPVITTPPGNIPPGIVGQAYTLFQFSANYCGGGCSWSLATGSGALPLGLSLSGAGAITGTPEGCANFWGANAPCNFGDSATTCGNNTFSPMICLIAVQATSSGTSLPVNFNVPINWAPTEAAYLSQQYGFFSQMIQTAGTSVPPIAGGGHLVIANGNFRDQRYDNLGAWNAWIDAMNAAGMHIVNIEVDLECLLSNRPTCLALYAGAIAHAHQLGMSVSINPEYYGQQPPGGTPSCGDAGCPGGGNGDSGGIAGACSIALGHNINSGMAVGMYGSGVNDWYTCLVTYSSGPLGMPAYQYILQNWLTSADRFVPVHEPTTQAAGWGEGILASRGCQASTSEPNANTPACSGQPNGSTPVINNTCPADWVKNFLTPFFTMELPMWSVPSHVQYGVTVDYPEMTGSNSYASAFSMDLAGGSFPAINMGVDLYQFDTSEQTQIAATISMFQGGTGGPAHTVFAEEFGPQAWTYAPMSPPYGAPPTGEACAIVGLQSCTWNGFNQSFFAALLSFLASQGVTDASLYGTEMPGACVPVNPNNGQNTGVLYAATTAMQNHQYSLASAGISAILSSWNRTSLRGCSLVGGALVP
jgi:hypothetical protein